MKNKSSIIKIGIVVVAILLTMVVFLDMVGIGGGNNPVDIKVEKGTGLAAVSDTLKGSGIISNKFMFKAYAYLTGKHIYQAGTHRLNSSMSYREIMKILETMPEDDEVQVLIPEGYEIYKIADTLSEKGLINKEIFMREVQTGDFDYEFVRQIPERENRLEGYLFPDTYNFSTAETEYDIIDKMLKNFEKQVLPVYQESGTDKSLDDIIKLASIIEREAANDDERKLVSSVLTNRLNIGHRLESCATVQYILKERKSVLSNEDTRIDSPYNTYLNSGLPIGPISAPGIKSIEAAIYPAETNYMFFLAVGDGSYSLFSETMEEHLEKQKEIQGS